MPRILPLLPLVLLLAAACSPRSSGESAPLEAAQPLRIAEVPLMAEIALNRQEQATGLMHRDSMPEDHGMLFLYRQPQRMGFWMKNTRIPLDLGFFSSEGILLQVIQLYPQDRSTRQSHSDQVQFALEMNQGWFQANHLKPGARLDLELLREALNARGADPRDYGL